VIRCDETQLLLDFCHSDPLRYSAFISDLTPVEGGVAAALVERYWVQDGRLVDRGEPTQEPVGHNVHYLDSEEDPSLLACVRSIGPCAKLRLEGVVPRGSEEEVREWVRELAPVGAATTSEDIKRLLSDDLGATTWREAGHYTTTVEEFKPRAAHSVRRASPADRLRWQRFVAENMDDPMVSGRKGCGSVVREFEFMCMGLPVDYYIAEKDGEIAGVASFGPLINHYDDIRILFVSPRHRRQGFGASLLSAAMQDILARGRRPAYFAGGEPGPLLPLLACLGYRLNSTLYWTERYTWYDWVLVQR